MPLGPVFSGALRPSPRNRKPCGAAPSISVRPAARSTRTGSVSWIWHGQLRLVVRRDPLGGTTAGRPPMHPKQSEADDQADLFRARLETLVARRHPLVRLAAL